MDADRGKPLEDYIAGLKTAQRVLDLVDSSDESRLVALKAVHDAIDIIEGLKNMREFMRLVDAEDRTRTLSNKEKVLAYLREHGSATNQRLRGIGGSRALARVHELQQEGHPITVRKLKGAEWEIRYAMPPLGRDAGSRAEQKSLF